MMHFRHYFGAAWLALLVGSYASPAGAQTVSVSEDFNTTTTTNPWYALGDACLTASSTAGSATESTAGTPPGCIAIRSSYGENLVGGYNGTGGTTGTAGSAQTLPDPAGYGALRFTNGCIWTSGAPNCTNGGHSQHGAIISGGSPYSSSAGIQVTFKTATYRGDSYNGSGGDSDGADGMSFFLIDGSVQPNIGSYGGSLAYSCSNEVGNSPNTGMVGGYIGLGIDEYGNFLNAGDNTVTGYGYVPNRIGLRGAGNVAWSWLVGNSTTSGYYNNSTYVNPLGAPTPTQSLNQIAAVRYTCQNGYASDYTGASVSSTKIYPGDYAVIPNAYKTIPTTVMTIGDEYAKGGYSRQNATTLLYRLVITPAGLLSLSYSTGGSWMGILTNQSITASNGTIPSTIRFGFAGSTGGGSNIHEVLCFKANSLDTSTSSAGSNLQQSAEVTTSSQAYFAYYNPNDWTGSLTASQLVNTSGVLSIGTTYWDASCVLTGVANLAPPRLNSSGSPICPTTGLTTPASAEAPTSRVILSWNGTTGIAFEWASLTTAQQNALDPGDANAYRLQFLRGSRAEEAGVTGSLNLYRSRDSVLGDIVDSSPVAVGQPVLPYPNTWNDKLVTTDALAENSGSQNYTAFFVAEQTRENVVYVGANDGLLHGFRAGQYSTSNVYSGTNNDGTEVFAYMPAAVVNDIHNATTVELDYSNPQYGHNFYVDATPGTGDLFYEGVWHTWLVGGLGVGGAAIYAIDITKPSNFGEASTNAASLVIGEWNPSTITCSGNPTCGTNMGNTFGTPIIRRLHNGDWAVIFGNGFGSASGDAGVYIMTIDQATAMTTTYYLSTGKAGSNDGIAYVSSADLDGDHITDYLYAGDLLGNVWRFDLTSGTAANWAAAAAPLFSAGSSQPITSSLLVASVVTTQGNRLMIAFGTGQQTQLTNSTPTSYAAGLQSLYAIWDWNMTTWNGESSIQYASLNSTSTNFTSLTGLSSPFTLAPANLTAQALADNTALNTVDVTASVICWAGTTICASDKKFGWSATLPAASEQIIYNPELVGSAFVVNSVVPANNAVLSCTTAQNSGYTYAIDLASGGVAQTGTIISSTGVSSKAINFFVNSGDANAGGTLTNATGTSLMLATSTTGNTPPACVGAACAPGGPGGGGGGPFPNFPGCQPSTNYWLMNQTSSGAATYQQYSVACPLTGKRLMWLQKR